MRPFRVRGHEQTARAHSLMSALIDLRSVRFAYPGGRQALTGVSLRVCEGELVAVVGANGSGKSTLARILGGLERVSSAEGAVVCGADLTTTSGRLSARREVGVLFQDPENQFVGADVEEDLAFGPENLGWPSEEIQQRVDELVRSFGMEDLRRREPHTLSGGQKQRVALAGVLAVPRRLLVLDEPTSMLDPAGAREVLAAVDRLHTEGLTVILVTQEMAEAATADRVVALRSGVVAYDGSPGVLFADQDLVADLSLGLPLPTAVAVEIARRGGGLGALPLDLDGLVAALGGASS